MSDESDARGAVAPEAAPPNPAPRRVRLVKAMAAAARAREVHSPPPEQGLHSRSFKLSHADELRLDFLKRRLASQGIRIKKGDLLRAALWVLADLDDSRLREAVGAPDHAASGRSGLAS